MERLPSHPPILTTGAYVLATPEMTDAEVMACALKVADTTIAKLREDKD